MTCQHCAPEPPCCWECSPDYGFMLLCPKCGNKRCPRATSHVHDCTESNESGQLGSRYTSGPRTPEQQARLDAWMAGDFSV